MDNSGKELVKSFCHLSRFEGMNIRLGLAPLQSLLVRLGYPQNAYPSVLVGGTNGKGSVVAMLASILHEAAFTVGIYTSPHLFNFNERIRIGHEPIGDSEISEFIKKIRSFSPETVSWFELVTALAFSHFQHRAVAIAVLEVGLGGRLDATNTAPSDLCAITNISLEHQEYLGDTIAAIANEKAGIIRTGGTCVTCERNEEPLKIITEHARTVSADILKIDKDFYFEENEKGLIYCSNRFGKIAGIEIPLAGEHQRDNALAAITLSLCLVKKGFFVSEDAIRKGLQQCVWRGRFETISEKPLIIFDGAHNLAGMLSLATTIKERLAGRQVTMILGFLRDKDYKGMLEAIAPVSAKIILTKPPSPRALSPAEIISNCHGKYPEIEAITEPIAALERALSLVDGKEGAVCIAGSLMLAAPLKVVFGLQD